MKPKVALRHFLALAGSSLLAISSASAQGPYYWDGNDSTSGFGAAGGTWAAPTSGTATSGWSTSATGVTAVDANSVTTTTADSVNFGTNTALYGLAAGTINVSGSVNAGTITQGAQSGAITLSGGTINLAAAGTISVANTVVIDSLITGAGTSLTKAGGGTLRLTNTANTYTGATLIGQSTGGVLEATFLADGGLASSIGASSSAAANLVLSNINAGFLRYIGTTNSSTDRLFTLGNQQGYAGGFEVTGTGTLNLTNTGSVAFAQPNASRIFSLGGTNTGQNILNAQLVNNGTGALSFIKNGTGNWVLANNTNSYTGTTTLNAGTLSVSKMTDYGTDSAIGKGTAGAAIVFNNGALVYTGSGDDTDRLIQLTTNGTILNNGTDALNFTATGNFNNQASSNATRTLTLGGTNGGTISGAIQNNTGTGPAVNLTKIGSGTWTLGGTNTYTGTTGVNAGTLRLQSGATTITQTLGALASQVADGTLNSDKSGTGSITTTFSSYTRSAGATGNIVSTGGTNGTDNSVNITGAAGFINAGLYFGGSDFAARNATNGYVRALAYGSDTDAVALNTVTASKHVKLTTTSYSGAGVTLLSLNLAGSGINWTNTTGNLTTPGILKSGGGSQSTISGGNVGTPSNSELVIRTDTSSDSLLISSNLTHGGGTLTKSGAGTLTLSGTNTFTGQTHVNAGTLSIGANVHLGAQTTGATLNLKGGTLQVTADVGLFNGTAGTNNRAVTLLNQSTIEVIGTNTLTIAGVISNNASAGLITPGFNKTGTGTLQLSGTNTYTGPTNINNGTLHISSTGSVNSSSGITVNGGHFKYNSSTNLTAPLTFTSGTVSGTNLAGISLTVGTGDTISPGNSPGTMNVADQTWASGGTYLWELYDTTGVAGNTTGWDLLSGTGTLNITASLGSEFIIDLTTLASLSPDVLGDALNFNSGSNYSWLIADFAAIAGFDATDFTIDATGFDNAYTGTFGLSWTDGATDKIFLNYTAIPEPGSALLGGLGLLALLRRRR